MQKKWVLFCLAMFSACGIEKPKPEVLKPAVSTPEEAAENAATSDPSCTLIAPFYWEIGDTKGKLAAGSVGDQYSDHSKMLIASASKWVFGAYVVERETNLDAETKDALRMLSGYIGETSLNCRNAETIQECYDDLGATLVTDSVGKFNYGNGHFNHWAITHGMADLGGSSLVAEMQTYLGSDLNFAYPSPQLAGGAQASPHAYALFLQKILNGQLRIGGLLGADPVCTLPSACPTAESSPAPAAWHYSYGHWVEDNADGDGAFSSPGLFGFYPWIDATKKYYGIVARQKLGLQEYVKSATCGMAIRKAFISAIKP